MDYNSPWNSPGQNAGVGSLSPPQVIVSTQGSMPGLLHCRWILYQQSHKGNMEVTGNTGTEWGVRGDSLFISLSVSFLVIQ